MQLPIRTDSLLSPAVNEAADSEAVIHWALDRFAQQRMILTTGFGMEGCALIEMFARHSRPLDVVYLDTGFLFPETYRLIDELKARHPHLRFLNQGTKMTPEEQETRYGKALWERDPDLCCRLRKVDPMRRALQGVDVWTTALRRDQSPTRADLKILEWNWKYEVLKFSPLANWSRQEVWDFIKSNQVPYNPLHEQGFPSIGCTHCTRPVQNTAPGIYSREGRWQGLEKTECGLHS